MKIEEIQANPPSLDVLEGELHARDLEIAAIQVERGLIRKLLEPHYQENNRRAAAIATGQAQVLDIGLGKVN